MTKKVSKKSERKSVTKIVTKKEDKLVKVKVYQTSVYANGDGDFAIGNFGKEVEIKESLKKKIESAFKKYEEVQNELAKLYFES